VIVEQGNDAVKTFKIPNGAERNSGEGHILALETKFGDRLYITGFPEDTVIRVYRMDEPALTGKRVPFGEASIQAKDFAAAATAMGQDENGGL
jgi:hypothetical protein